MAGIYNKLVVVSAIHKETQEVEILIAQQLHKQKQMVDEDENGRGTLKNIDLKSFVRFSLCFGDP